MEAVFFSVFEPFAAFDACNVSAVFSLTTAPPDGLAFDEMFFTRNFGFADFDDFLF